MTFELLPTIDTMLALYQKTRNLNRFKEYLKLIQSDTKGDLVFPVGGFNPMAKEHTIQKLMGLKELNAEKIIQQTINEINTKLTDYLNKGIFRVALNPSDDLEDGWTNRYTSDYSSKFELNALIKRKFCMPIFWTSEQYSQPLIKERTLQYCFRTVSRLANPKPETLQEHIVQERFVAKHIDEHSEKRSIIDFEMIDTFYNRYRNSDNYHIIFNFLYGDSASRSLKFPCFGIPVEMTGYKYACLTKLNHQ